MLILLAIFAIVSVPYALYVHFNSNSNHDTDASENK
jgi:hypothetical protein